MSLVTGLARSLGLDGNLEMTVGSLFTETRSASTWFLGLAFHLIYGAICGVAYAFILSRWRPRRRASAGAEIGVIHGVLASVGLAFIPAIHPAIPEIMSSSIAFLTVLGISFFIAVHAMYGAIVGALSAPGVWR